MHRSHRFNVMPPPLNNGEACPCLAFHPVTGIGSTLSAPRLAMLFRVIICFRGEGCKLSLDQLWLIAPRAYRSENMDGIHTRKEHGIHPLQATPLLSFGAPTSASQAAGPPEMYLAVRLYIHAWIRKDGWLSY